MDSNLILIQYFFALYCSLAVEVYIQQVDVLAALCSVATANSSS